MKGEFVYNFLTLLIIFIIIELIIAIINQYYVPPDVKYDQLTITQKILSNLRFYFNIIETILIFYVLFYYYNFLNNLTILLLVSILIACFRYFLFALGLIYYFIDKTERNTKIVEFIEGPIGKTQNKGIALLLFFIIIRIYIFKIY